MHKLCQAVVTGNHLLALLRENYSQHFNGHYIFICAHSIITELFSVGISEKIAIPWHVYILWAPLSHLFLFFPHSPSPLIAHPSIGVLRLLAISKTKKCDSWLIGMLKHWLNRNYRCEQLCESRFTVHAVHSSDTDLARNPCISYLPPFLSLQMFVQEKCNRYISSNKLK